jgi:mannan endo-1,4-beta-mannosidase
MTSPTTHAIGVLLLLCRAPLGAQAQSPVNPHVSPEARALLTYLYSISGHYILTGQHNYPNTIANWTDRAYDFTGKYPAVYGQDFGFQGGADKDSTLARPALVAEAMRQYRNGAIVTFTWHAVRPTDDEPATFRDSVQGHLSDFEWRELLTPGTTLYKRWCAQVDVIAGYLKQLRDAHVPVLWRSYHEVNGNWFWWGGRKGNDGSAALYRQLFDRFVNYHHLDNVVWVWNANSPGSGGTGPGPYADYFPGLEYADVLSVDIYGEFKQNFYDDLLALSGGKPVALGEVGGLPSPATLKEQPKYTWFMTWSEFIEMSNPLAAVRAVYDDPHALNRDDPHMSEAMAAIRKASAAPDPHLVTPEPLPAARELLAKLYHAAGQGILSGQDNDSKPAAAATQRVFELTAKHPAIYGADLAEPGAQAVVDQAVSQYRSHAMVTLSWRPARPTDDGSGKLSDFEWKELLTPGTRLFARWSAQVDVAAGYLQQLQEAGVPVLWRPYPRPNSAKFWWAGHKAESAALYRQLFDRLVSYHKLHNLVWVWNAAAPGVPSGPGSDSPGQWADYFPGLEYADALAVDLDNTPFSWRRDAELARFAVGKVIGLGLDGWMPTGAMLEQPTRWAWFLASGAEQQPDALRALYANPRVVSRQ